MRFFVIVKATPDSESGRLPVRSELEEMGTFNEGLVRDGMMLSGDGLWASKHGARMYFDGGTARVVEGPFAQVEDLIAGFWIVQAPSMDAVVERFKSVPFKHGESIEIRRFFEAEDFGDEFTPEAREKVERMRESVRG